ncbi:uncharacterized protein RJT20DRAFT_135576 [Scheffersomyces xylosifermentans]|uniref:uncharacterized protein n=1 Tax=Scheffersomyces xylosifermentans TaxID=1304137 RepID=UPI00315CFFE4
MVSIRIPVLIIFVLSFIGAAYLGFASLELQHDKLLHFVAFLVLTAEFYFIFDTKHKSLKTLRTITLVVCTFGASIGSEVVQSIVNTERTFDPNDIAFNIAGSLVGLAASSGYEHWKVKRSKAQRLHYRQLQNDDTYQVGESPSTRSDSRSTPENEEDGYVSIQMNDVDSTHKSSSV